MTKFTSSIAVTSRTFSKNERLRSELLSKFENVKFNMEGKKLENDELVNFLSECEGAIVALERIDKSLLEQLPHLKIISKYGVGLDNLDLDYLNSRSIKLGWTPGVNARSVAELTLSFMLGLMRNVLSCSREMYEGVWSNRGGFQLSSKTVGIVGCGFIGQEVINLLKPFSCKVLVYDILDKSKFCTNQNVICVSLDDLLYQSDIVSLHIPYNKNNHLFFDLNKMKKMKRGAFLVNTSRGGIVDEEGLFQLLNEQHLAGSASDVFAVEPNTTSPLLKHKNFFATSHIGGSTEEAVLNMGKAAIDNLIHHFEGKENV